MGKLMEDILNLRAIHNGDLEFFDKIDWMDARGKPQLNFADQVMIYGKLIPMRDFFDASFSPLISVSDRLKAVLKINPLLNPEPMVDFLNEEQQKWEKERTSFTLDSILKFLGPILEEAILPDCLIFWATGLGTLIDKILIESGAFEFIDVKLEKDEEGRPVLNPEDKIKTLTGSVYTVGEVTDPSVSDSFSPCDFTNAVVDRNQPLNTRGMYPQLEQKQIEWKERKAFREAIEEILDSPEPIKGLAVFLTVHAVKNELIGIMGKQLKIQKAQFDAKTEKERTYLKFQLKDLASILWNGAAWAAGMFMMDSIAKRSRPKPVIDFLK